MGPNCQNLLWGILIQKIIETIRCKNAKFDNIIALQQYGLKWKHELMKIYMYVYMVCHEVNQIDTERTRIFKR